MWTYTVTGDITLSTIDVEFTIDQDSGYRDTRVDTSNRSNGIWWVYLTGYGTISSYSYLTLTGTVSLTLTFADGSIYYDTLSYNMEYYKYPECFSEDTMLTLADGSTKQAKDITYNDTLLAYNFDEGHIDKASIAWLSNRGLTHSYWEVELSNGTLLKLVGWKEKSHRLFNAEQGAFIYPQDFKTYEHTVTEMGDLVTIVRCERVVKEIYYYNLTTAYRLNCYINGICSGSRLSNIYPIVAGKYIKEARTPISDFSKIPRHYIDELRLLEQPEQNKDNSVIFVDTLEDHIYNNYYKKDRRYFPTEEKE